MTVRPVRHRTALTDARLLDPASGLDRPGDLLDRRRQDHRLRPQPLSRWRARRQPADRLPGPLPGARPGRYARAAARARRGAQGDHRQRQPGGGGRRRHHHGRPAQHGARWSHDVAGVEYVARRARETKLVKIFTYGAVTRGLEGEHDDRVRAAQRVRRRRLYRWRKSRRQRPAHAPGAVLRQDLRQRHSTAPGRAQPGRRA